MTTIATSTNLNLPRDKTFILIPAFNETEVIREVVEKIKKAGYKNIVIVDDGSSDNLSNCLKGIPVYYIRHANNLGQGAALQTGFNFVKTLDFEYLITFDADGQHDPQNLDAILQEIVTTKTDIILGSRFLLSNNKLPFKKRILLKLARYVNYFFTGLLLSDAHNGLRLLNKKSVKCINLTENGMAHATEFLFEIKSHKLTFKEVPVIIHYSEYSMSKGQRISNSIKILINLFLYKTSK
jgi:polyprenyl-phospho-N-acetylgalactosaminyl synthase